MGSSPPAVGSGGFFGPLFSGARPNPSEGERQDRPVPCGASHAVGSKDEATEAAHQMVPRISLTDEGGVAKKTGADERSE